MSGQERKKSGQERPKRKRVCVFSGKNKCFLNTFENRFWSPKSGQERPKSGQEPPRATQERPKSGQERPKNGQERPKSGLRTT